MRLAWSGPGGPAGGVKRGGRKGCWGGRSGERRADWNRSGEPTPSSRRPEEVGFSLKLARSGLLRRSLRPKSDPARGHQPDPGPDHLRGGAAWRDVRLSTRSGRRGCRALRRPAAEEGGGWSGAARPSSQQGGRSGAGVGFLARPPTTAASRPRGLWECQKEAGECGGAGETAMGCRRRGRKKGKEQKGKKGRRAVRGQQTGRGREGGNSEKGGAEKKERGGREREETQRHTTGARASSGRKRDCERRNGGERERRSRGRWAGAAGRREPGEGQRASGKRQRVKWARRRRRRAQGRRA